jgi:transcriptional regulator with GAF, ATPase, and Fis domain
VQEAVVGSLAAIGLSLDASTGAIPAGPGLVLFDEVTEALRDFVRRAGDAGMSRLLALAASPSALDGRKAWDLVDCGAADVLAWNARPRIPEEVLAKLERWRAIDELFDAHLVRERIAGRSRSLRRVLRQVIEAARFTEHPILITGESGTGKELLAQLVHRLDPRPNLNALVIVDCTTIVPELSGSEFFGHERGAFTGAVAPRIGAFELADGGTLFLDEVGELPLPLQAELLRVIQERTFKRVGSNTWRQTQFRLVCATHRDLRAELSSGRFRRDFYFRIASCTCHLPPLRERVEDILPMVDHFLRGACGGVGELPLLDEPVREFLLQRSYPGNARELRHLVLRIASRHTGPGPITLGDIPEDERPAPSMPAAGWDGVEFKSAIRHAVIQGAHLKELGQAAAEHAVEAAIDVEEGNLARAAARLGVTVRAIQMRMAKDRADAEGSPSDERP